MKEYGTEMLLYETGDDAQSIWLDELVMWYGYRIIDSANASDYIKDDADGFYVPEGEFEKLVYGYFGLTPEHLRESETYITYRKRHMLRRQPFTI